MQKSRSVHSEPQPESINGRGLPKLLFLTNLNLLRGSIGDFEVNRILCLIFSENHVICDLSEYPYDSDDGLRFFYSEIEMVKSEIKGVVILGDYDVIAPRKILVTDITQQEYILRANSDASSFNNIYDDIDNFYVISDDIYSQENISFLNEKKLKIPYFPLSRIPCSDQSDFIYNLLTKKKKIKALRNVLIRLEDRIFSDLVFLNTSSNMGEIYTSPYIFGSQGRNKKMVGDNFYIVLHGDYYSNDHYFGFEANGDRDRIFDIRNDTIEGNFFYTTSCWGGLISSYIDNRMVSRTVQNSLPLNLLSKTAHNFIGSTALHYSSSQDDQSCMFFGNRFDWHFWNSLKEIHSPAKALLEAKILYSLEIPSISEDPIRAIFESKILWCFSCLGLGW